MTRDMTVGDLVSLLKREIADRQRLVDDLEARVAPKPTGPRVPRKTSVASATAEILRETGRPMHGLDEIFPELSRRGLAPRSRAGFATTLLRTGEIVRTAPGTYALRDAGA